MLQYALQRRKDLARYRLDFEQLDLVPINSALQNIPLELNSSLNKTAVTRIQEIATRWRGNVQFDLIEAIVMPLPKHTIRLTYTLGSGKCFDTYYALLNCFFFAG